MPGILPNPTPLYPADWRYWAASVLTNIGAPVTNTNLDTLWAWTWFEKPHNNVIQWNNPLNTKQPEPGSTNAFQGVQAYSNLDSGARATSDTLLNGRFPSIVQSLRAGSPRGSWGTAARAEIKTWGTNSAFLTASIPGPTGKESGSSGLPGSPTGPGGSFAPAGDPFGINSAISGFGKTLSDDLVHGVEVSLGLVLMLAGIALLVLMVFKVDPTGIARQAALLTPQGRAAAVLSPPAKPALSPQAQAAVEAARAGRGSRLSPEVKAELKGRAA